MALNHEKKPCDDKRVRRGLGPPHLSRVRDWTTTPSHFLNQQLDVVWLAE